MGGGINEGITDVEEEGQFLYATALDIATIINKYADKKEDVVELLETIGHVLQGRYGARLHVSFEESGK